MPKANPNEARGEQMDIEATQITAKGQAHDAYRQCSDAFILINNSNVVLRNARDIIEAFARDNGRTTIVTETLGKVERVIKANVKWMAENQK